MKHPPANTPFPLHVRAMVFAMLDLPQDRQRELMRCACLFLERKTAKPVASLYEFVTAPAGEFGPEEERSRLLGIVARCFKANDTAELEGGTDETAR